MALSQYALKGKGVDIPSAVVLPEGTDDWTIPETVRKHKYFVEVTTSLVAALEELDRRMQGNKDHRLFTRKGKRALGGTVVQAGEMGFWSRNGRPIITIQPGNYWNMSIRHKWVGKYSITASIDMLGLTVCQVGQSEAAVVMDPENKIFIIRNGGFVAYGSEGRFKIIAIVDTLDLGDNCIYRETTISGQSSTSRILGWKRDVKTTVQGTDGTGSLVTAATFFNVPANNVLVLQRGNELLILKAGQHVITNPDTSFRGFFSLGERQTTFKTQPAYTIEGVPVILHVNLRYRVVDPILLTANYDDAFQALANPAQTAVNSVVSRLSYQQFMRAKNVGGDIPDFHTAPWLDSFKSECLKDLTHQAEAYGIKVESFDVLDRELQGKLGKDLEMQSEQVLRNQVQATQIELQNHIATETQRGKLEIAKVEAEQTRTVADAEFYVATKKADASAYQVIKNAEAQAEASEKKVVQDAKNTVTNAEAQAQASERKTIQDAKNIITNAEAQAKASEKKTAQDAKNNILLAEAKRTEIEVISKAYASVPQGHAQIMQLTAFEVEKRKALPPKTIYFTGDHNEEGVAKDLKTGLGTAAGWSLGQKIGNGN